MWRFTAIVMAFFAYLPARYLLSNVITGTSQFDIIALNITPLIACLVLIGIVIVAPE
jgi:hypothetical protein